jgi:major intrinsic protein
MLHSSPDSWGGHVSSTHLRVSRNLLARAGRMRRRSDRCGVPCPRYRVRRVSLAFGLTVLTGAYTFGPISGAHFNPAVTVGLWAGGRFEIRRVLPYIVSQVLGAVAASARPLRDRQRRTTIRSRGRIRGERLRCAFTGRLLAGLGATHRGRDDVHVSDRDPRVSRRVRAGRSGDVQPILIHSGA